MNIKAVLDKRGKIISAVYQTKHVLEDDMPKPHMGPELEEGQTLVELGTPDEYANYPVAEFIERITADVKAKSKG